jgi:hypothetical protein
MDQKEFNASRRAHSRLPVFGNKSRGAKSAVAFNTNSFDVVHVGGPKGHTMPTRMSEHEKKWLGSPAYLPELDDSEPDHFLNRHARRSTVDHETETLQYMGVHQRSDHNTGKDKFRGLRREADRHHHHRQRQQRRAELADLV